MSIVSKSLQKTVHLAFLACLFFTLFSCSQLESVSTSSIKFSVSASRAVLNIPEGETVFIYVELQGVDIPPVTEEFSNDKTSYNFVFDKIPVGEYVTVSAQIYREENGRKIVFYSGTSETLKVHSGENAFTLTLKRENTSVEEPGNDDPENPEITAPENPGNDNTGNDDPKVEEYNITTSDDSSYIVKKPLLTIEHNNTELSTNILEFNSDKDDETFCWTYANLGEYQIAEITFTGNELPPESTNQIRFRFVKSATGVRYPLDTVNVESGSYTCSFDIPQGIGLDGIAIENNWDDENSRWAQDFSCIIEEIKLIKNDELIDPDFNKITTPTETTCVIQKPAIQSFVGTQINKNIITFDSTNARNYNETGSGFSAAYWEFADLKDYDKVTVKVKAENPNNFSQIRIIVKGFSPRNYSKNEPDCYYSADIQKVIETAGTTQTLTFYLTELTNGLGDHPLAAILFQNDSYTGDWIQNPPEGTSADKDLDYGNPWQLEIEEIVLEKTPGTQIGIGIDNPSESSDINVSVDDSVSGRIIFTAPEDYTSYTWKVDGVPQEDFTENILILDLANLSTGTHDISLLADSHSWNTQITRN